MAPKTSTGRGLKRAQGMNNPPAKRLYDLKEAALYLGRPIFSVRVLIWNGELPFIKNGRKYYVDICDMDTYIETKKERMM